MRPRRRVAAVAIAALIAGCAALPPRLVAPEVEVAAVRVVEARLPTVRLSVDLVVTNPNAVAIELAGLDADLAIEGERVGSARLARPATLPAQGATRVLLAADADAGAALAGLGRALGGARPLAYDLAGRATLADGRTFPFRRRGEIPVPGGGGSTVR